MPESSADDERTINTLARRLLIGLLANRNALIAVAAVVLAAVAGACGSDSSRQSVPSIPSAVSGAAPAASSPAASSRADVPVTARRPTRSAAALRVLTGPAAGIGPVYQLITGARSAVDLTMYELADPTAEADLAADAARGVDVRVLLDQHLGRSANTGAYDYLTAHGVHARWGPAGTIYHQKTLTVDDATSVIMTGNLVAEYYAGTRDFAVIDTGRADVAAIAATFDADFAGTATLVPRNLKHLARCHSRKRERIYELAQTAGHAVTVGRVGEGGR